MKDFINAEQLKEFEDDIRTDERVKVFDACYSYFEEHASEVYQHICARDFILDSLEEIERGYQMNDELIILNVFIIIIWFAILFTWYQWHHYYSTFWEFLCGILCALEGILCVVGFIKIIIDICVHK